MDCKLKHHIQAIDLLFKHINTKKRIDDLIKMKTKVNNQINHVISIQHFVKILYYIFYYNTIFLYFLRKY